MFKRDKHLQTETEIISPGFKTGGRGRGVDMDGWRQRVNSTQGGLPG